MFLIVFAIFFRRKSLFCLPLLFFLLAGSSVFGFGSSDAKTFSKLPVFVKSFRVYKGIGDKPGQKPNVLSLRLYFNKPNKAVVIQAEKSVPQLFVRRLNDKNQWVNGRIPAKIYQDDDGEYIVALRLDNLNRYFQDRSKGSWTLDDVKKEITRLETHKFWRLFIICNHQIKDKDQATNDLGFTRTRIIPDGFVENTASRGQIELKFHIGNLSNIVRLSDIGNKLYLLHKSDARRLEVIPNIKIAKTGKYYRAAMGAPQLRNFIKKLTGRDLIWNKKSYQDFVWKLQEHWKMYILSKHEKRYDNYNFTDVNIV